jgi:hypothetical protein
MTLIGRQASNPNRLRCQRVHVLLHWRGPGKGFELTREVEIESDLLRQATA